MKLSDCVVCDAGQKQIDSISICEICVCSSDYPVEQLCFNTSATCCSVCSCVCVRHFTELSNTKGPGPKFRPTPQLDRNSIEILFTVNIACCLVRVLIHFLLCQCVVAPFFLFLSVPDCHV